MDIHPGRITFTKTTPSGGDGPWPLPDGWALVPNVQDIDGTKSAIENYDDSDLKEKEGGPNGTPP